MRGFATARVLTLALALGAAGCDQVADTVRRVLGSKASAGNPGSGWNEPRVQEVATGEPGKDRLQWRAADDRTRKVLGVLTASQPDGRSGPLVLAFANGVTVQLEATALLTGADKTYPGGDAFATVLSGDPKAGVYIYQIADENVDQVAVQGGLCGAKRPSHVAISEYVGANGDWMFRLAAFEGPGSPGPDSPADPGACAVYAYTLN
jgi:hypothetical protein